MPLEVKILVHEKVFDKYSRLRNEAKYSYLRWLMIISTGAFSLTANIAFGKPYIGFQLLALKSALTANVVGILLGAVAVYGETKLSNGVFQLLCDKETQYLQGNHEQASKLGVQYILPSWMKDIEFLFYLSLLICLILWVVFIWLI